MHFVPYAVRLEKNVILPICCGICGSHTVIYEDLNLLHVLPYGFHVVPNFN